MDLLGGKEEESVWQPEGEEERGEGEKKEERDEGLTELTDEELATQWRKLKLRKAPREDGIENETWKYMTGEIGEVWRRLVKEVWKKGKTPEDWKEGIISPIYKKEEKSVVGNYRGVTLLNTAYKIYASILNDRLRAVAEEKLQESQFGFRKGRGTADAIFVLNYIVNKELKKKGGKVFAFFVDLKAAFDNVDRQELNERMKAIGTEDHLRRRIIEIYRETKNTVKIGERRTETFWTERGVRQGYPMSPTLFNIYVSDLEEEMKKEQEEGMTIGREKLWTIAYADDIVLLGRGEKELQGMMRRFKRYLEKKKMTLSTEKSKILVFEDGRGRKKKREWKWEEEDIEEVREIKYLGYMMQKNGGSEKHLAERFKRASVAMKKTWSIGEKVFKDDFGRRMKMFEALVGSVALYGAEIWGWTNDARLDRIKRKYVKWILGLDRTTPNHILVEETKLREIKTEALRRAVKFEEKERNGGKKIVAECFKVMDRQRAKKEEGKWEAARSRLLGRLGMEKKDLDEVREAGSEEVIKTILEKIEVKEKEERRRKLEESRYNRTYKNVVTENMPKYLSGRRKRKDRSLIARYRCGNECKENQHWKEEEEKTCRLCEEETESIEHIIRDCRVIGTDLQIGELLNEDGRGLETLKGIEEARRRKREIDKPSGSEPESETLEGCKAQRTTEPKLKNRR